MTATPYARLGPPFNFQGTMLDTQKDAFVAWDQQHRGDFPAISTFHRIRAQQLRKAAGLLEDFYATQDTPLTPTFVKDTWQPSENGHFLPTMRDDHLPSVTVAAINDRYQDQLGYHDSAVFRMNWLRTQIEATEDLAQETHEAPDFVGTKFQTLEGLFSTPHYAGVLVNTKDTFKGQPRHRAHPYDPPTPWERRNAGELIS